MVSQNVISESQVQSLLEQPNQESVLGVRDAAMLQLCYDSGLRVAKLITLTFGQVKRGWLEIRGKREKRKASSIFSKIL